MIPLWKLIEIAQLLKKWGNEMENNSNPCIKPNWPGDEKFKKVNENTDEPNFEKRIKDLEKMNLDYFNQLTILKKELQWTNVNYQQLKKKLECIKFILKNESEEKL